MPLCYKCKVMLPPDMCYLVQPGNLHICLFCKNDRSTVVMGDMLITKQQASDDYCTLLNKLAASKDVKKVATDLTVSSAVKKSGFIH